MTVPQRALSAILCVLAALALGLVARWPAMIDRVEARQGVGRIIRSPVSNAGYDANSFRRLREFLEADPAGSFTL